ERDFRTRIVQAFNGTGLVGNDRQFWSTLLTAINGTETYAQTENEFRNKLVEAVENYSPTLPDDQAVVEDGDTVALLGATVTLSVDNNEIDGASIPGTFGVVEDGDQLPATGGTVVISVTGNTVSAEFAPD